MDFTFDEEQTAVEEAAEGIFAGLVTPDRVQEVEATEDRVDRELWAELAKADLLGLAVPEAVRRRRATAWSSWPWCSRPRAGRWRPVPAVGHPRPRAPCRSPSSGREALRARVLPGVVAGDTVLTARWPTWPATSPLGGPGRPSVYGHGRSGRAWC